MSESRGVGGRPPKPGESKGFSAKKTGEQNVEGAALSRLSHPQSSDSFSSTSSTLTSPGSTLEQFTPSQVAADTARRAHNAISRITELKERENRGVPPDFKKLIQAGLSPQEIHQNFRTNLLSDLNAIAAYVGEQRFANQPTFLETIHDMTQAHIVSDSAKDKLKQAIATQGKPQRLQDELNSLERNAPEMPAPVELKVGVSEDAKRAQREAYEQQMETYLKQCDEQEKRRAEIDREMKDALVNAEKVTDDQIEMLREISGMAQEQDELGRKSPQGMQAQKWADAIGFVYGILTPEERFQIWADPKSGEGRLLREILEKTVVIANMGELVGTRNVSEKQVTVQGIALTPKGTLSPSQDQSLPMTLRRIDADLNQNMPAPPRDIISQIYEDWKRGGEVVEFPDGDVCVYGQDHGRPIGEDLTGYLIKEMGLDPLHPETLPAEVRQFFDLFQQGAIAPNEKLCQMFGGFMNDLPIDLEGEEYNIAGFPQNSWFGSSVLESLQLPTMSNALAQIPSRDGLPFLAIKFTRLAPGIVEGRIDYLNPKLLQRPSSGEFIGIMGSGETREFKLEKHDDGHWTLTQDYHPVQLMSLMPSEPRS